MYLFLGSYPCYAMNLCDMFEKSVTLEVSAWRILSKDDSLYYIMFEVRIKTWWSFGTC